MAHSYESPAALATPRASKSFAVQAEQLDHGPDSPEFQAKSLIKAIEHDDPIGAPEDPTAESQRLVFDEIAGSADLLVSYAIGLREAARRDDRDRVHSYLSDISKQFCSARDAYYRIRELARLAGPR